MAESLVANAPVAQRIECRPPKPKAQVRVLAGALLFMEQRVRIYHLRPFLFVAVITPNRRHLLADFLARWAAWARGLVLAAVKWRRRAAAGLP